MFSKLIRKDDVEFTYKNIYYRISIGETESFYIYDVFDKDGKPAIIDDGKDKYLIKTTISKFDEDGKDRVKIIGEDTIIEFIKSQIRGAKDHYDYLKLNNQI